MSEPRAPDAVDRYLERLRREPPPALGAHNLEAARRMFEEGAQRLCSVTSAMAPIAATLVRPPGCPELCVYRGSAAPSLAILFLHGGGFVMGSIASHDALCRDIAASSGAVVISAAYRLAPKDRFPAAHDDARAALRWIGSNLAILGVPPGRIVVMGDSAGGALAAALAFEAPRPLLQVLIYPALDLTASSPSHRTFGAGYGLDSETIQFCYRTYAPEPRSRIAASVLLRDDLSAAAPAIIAVGECDPLCDEAVRYAERLRVADVAVTLLRYPRMVHGFLSMPKLFPEARRALADVVGAIEQHLGEIHAASAPKDRSMTTTCRP